MIQKEGTAADSFVLRWLRQDITSEQSTLLKHAATDLLVGEEFPAFLFCFGKMNFDEIILSAGSETVSSFGFSDVYVDNIAFLRQHQYCTYSFSL